MHSGGSVHKGNQGMLCPLYVNFLFMNINLHQIFHKVMKYNNWSTRESKEDHEDIQVTDSTGFDEQDYQAYTFLLHFS